MLKEEDNEGASLSKYLVPQYIDGRCFILQIYRLTGFGSVMISTLNSQSEDPRFDPPGMIKKR